MEHVPGRTLKEIITAEAPLPPAMAAQYARQALAGLAAAHAVGIVHRDVKPQNLIVRDDGTLKVADFGVARAGDETMLTQHGAVIGTADYISPEQARGDTATAASDLYSVGVVLYELLTGSLPFTGELPLAVASQHVSSPAPSVLELAPSVPTALAHVVRRALSKDPALRQHSAEEMAVALALPPAEAATATQVAPTVRLPAAADATRVMPKTGPAVTQRSARRRAWAVPVAALALAALVVGAVFALATRGDGGARRVALPRLVGTPVASAASALRARGLTPRLASAIYASAPRGTVAAVRPRVATVEAGSAVTIVPSSGPRPIAVPGVAGLSLSAALTALDGAGLAAQTRTIHDAAPRGTAVATTPAEGTGVAPHSAVVLTVSAGPAPAAPSASSAPPGKAKGPAKDKPHGKGKGHAKKKDKGGD
jgi:serine/threonine-protein kinase